MSSKQKCMNLKKKCKTVQLDLLNEKVQLALHEMEALNQKGWRLENSIWKQQVKMK